MSIYFYLTLFWIFSLRVLYERVWDEADYVVPPAENGAFFVTTNVVITPNQTLGQCPEVSHQSGVILMNRTVQWSRIYVNFVMMPTLYVCTTTMETLCLLIVKLKVRVQGPGQVKLRVSVIIKVIVQLKSQMRVWGAKWKVKDFPNSKKAQSLGWMTSLMSRSLVCKSANAFIQIAL